jgi:hypothetical protein
VIRRGREALERQVFEGEPRALLFDPFYRALRGICPGLFFLRIERYYRAVIRDLVRWDTAICTERAIRDHFLWMDLYRALCGFLPAGGKLHPQVNRQNQELPNSESHPKNLPHLDLPVVLAPDHHLLVTFRAWRKL